MSRDKKNLSYWEALEDILNNSSVKIDRPKGSAHPRYPNFIYPVDYGFLEGTSSMDGGGIDVWKGTGNNGFDAILCVVDLVKKDSEIKILLDCTREEKEIILRFQNTEKMSAMVIKRVYQKV